MPAHRLVIVALTAVLCLLAVDTSVRAQEGERTPIQWSLKPKASTESIKPGERFIVELTAQIEKGWHLYSTERIEGGPIPTRIVLLAGQAFEPAGEIEFPAPDSSYDPNFQVTTAYYEGSVSFAIPVRAVPGSLSGPHGLKVEVRYQSCTQTLCLPPELLMIETTIQVAGNDPGPTRPAAKPAAAKENKSEGLSVGAEVPDFEFTDFSGKTHHFSEYRGRYVLLDFWATWCSPCLADIPQLKQSYQKYRARGFEIIGMDSETLGQVENDPEFKKETDARARQIVTTRGVPWIQATTATSVPVAVKVFGVESLPAKILIDPDGRIVARIKTRSELDSVLGTLLTGKQ
jgi:thiol-disulfide isomerase/thioredoxin